MQRQLMRIERLCQQCGKPFTSKQCANRAFCSYRPCYQAYLAKKIGTLEDYFWARVKKTSSCWLWTGRLNAYGYGRISTREKPSRTIMAHRLSWQIHFGPIPKGLIVCHTCDVRTCQNPQHLWLGTNATNAVDRDQKGRTAKGLDFPTRIALNPQKVIRIRAMHQTGRFTHQAIADKLKVSRPLVSYVLLGKIWRHV